MTDQYTIVDRAALALSSAAILFGVVVLGLVETLAGKPYAPVPQTNEAGKVVATPLISANVRTGFVLAGILILMAWALYRVATAGPDADDSVEGAPSSAD